jgi:hypothetical protein
MPTELRRGERQEEAVWDMVARVWALGSDVFLSVCPHKHLLEVRWRVWKQLSWQQGLEMISTAPGQWPPVLGFLACPG